MPGKVRVTEHHTCPATVDEIASAVARILALGGVEMLSLNEGEPIYVERIVEDESQEPDSMLPEVTLEDMLSRLTIYEWAPQPDDLADEPRSQLFSLFLIVGTGKLVVTHILCRDKLALRRWLGAEAFLVGDDWMVNNARVVEAAMLPPNVVIVFGAKRAGADPSETKVALKMTVGGRYVEQPPGDREPADDSWSDPEEPAAVSGGAGGAAPAEPPAWFGPQSGHS